MARTSMRVWVRVSWLLTAFIILGVGFGFVWWPASQEISQRHARALELYDEANSIDGATRRASQLREAQSRIAADLAQLGGLRSAGAVTAAVLRLLHDESKRDNVEIREVAPDPGTAGYPATGGTGSNLARNEDLTASNVVITVRGPFRNIVALVADLPRHDVLIDINDLQVSSLDSARKPPILDATLHSTIYRLTTLPSLGSSRARTIR